MPSLIMWRWKILEVTWYSPMEISLSCLLASMAQIKKALALLLFLLSHFSPRDVYHGQKRPEHVCPLMKRFLGPDNKWHSYANVRRPEKRKKNWHPLKNIHSILHTSKAVLKGGLTTTSTTGKISLSSPLRLEGSACACAAIPDASRSACRPFHSSFRS